ncbi:wings apart-like protein homolog [Myxocyprinus asiaticus]|uniref:wings apart-like protein homolog n=1 Tax=Myxocyprinus asiaticus TaxID=70543 RepID=UPI002222A107|nr:wings apart-like protein homolog [Myxocyprinus asiaticus]XP_051501725.1 wings apart-like protein homolog [Myxocyprinus asiaticus]
MTSRFSKTYTRKGGQASSKFDEVFSNKKATLSTKWGETTYKAQLGVKRPLFKPEVPDLTKQPRFDDDDSSEDPFGFDSDDESKTVTSRGTPQSEVDSDVAGTGNEQSKTAQTEKPSVAMTVTSEGTLGSIPSIERGVLGLSSPAKTILASSHVSGTEGAWNKSSLTVSKPLSQPSSIKTPSSDFPDNWDSPGVDSPPGAGEHSFTQAGNSSDGLKSSEQCPAGPEPVLELVDFEQLPLLKPASDRVYRRPNRNKGPDSFAAGDALSPAVGPTPVVGSTPEPAPVKTTSSGVAGSSEIKPAGRGRVRDYTVLHPSCVSVCNVTFQDSIERSVDEFVSPAPADMGDVGTFRRKTDTQPAKPTRFRPTQSKTKKETKLEFFGFEAQGADGEATVSGSTSYKIKYFGFDDLSESDSDEEEDSAAKQRKKEKKAATASQSASPNSPQISYSQESQQSESSTNTDSQESLDETGSIGSQKERHGKQTDKSKEIGRKIFSGPKKSPSKAVYNARHWNQPEPEEVPPSASSHTVTVPKASVSGGSKDTNSHKDDGVFKAPPPPPKVIKSVTIPTEPYQDIVTALKCRTEHKELYTVVQHVKHFNDVVEFGENQEFTDDFEYLETGLKSTQPLNTRCLSIISLATRCAMPSFRMHLRARGKVAQVFKMLSDAQQHPNLALCTASLMYILSRDRLNMDLDRSCLELMIRLLELEQDDSVADQLTAKEMSKVKEKIRKLCETVHNKHLDLENINTGHLAMETLLSLTSKRAGDWFKEELRLLGGLDHIVDKVKECVENLSKEEDKESLVASLWGAERCLRVLESVTVHNPENQAYLIAYKESQLIVSSARALHYCEQMIQRYSREVSSSSSALPQCSHINVGKAVEDCMRAVIGVLLNLTHDNEWGSTKTGEQDRLILTALDSVLNVPRYLPQEQRFDIRVLGLGLLINLVEYSARNRHGLVEMEVDVSYLTDTQGDMRTENNVKSEGEEGKTTEEQKEDKTEEEDKKEPTTQKSSNALVALVQFFLERERAAVLAEAQTDDLISETPKSQADQSGEWQETSGEIQWVASETNNTNDKKEEEEEELDLNKALQHAGKHMEDSIVASYTALLLGCLCQESPMNVKTVRETLPKGDFSIMTEMLKKFLNFMNLTCSVGTTGQKSITRVIEYLEHC